MTKFEQVGINRLYLATDKANLNRTFNHSCLCCCYKGMHIDCDRCAISLTHSMLVAIMDSKKGKPHFNKNRKG
jgi:hypothetical protein